MASSCDSTPDSGENFILKEPLNERTITCDWVRHRPQEQWIWCNYRNVNEMCPATCGGCQNISKPFCDEVLEFDNESRFYVEGTAGSEKRTCSWAARLNKIQRCSIKAVQINCPETCFTLCDERPTDPPSASSGSIIGNAIVDDPSSKGAATNEMKVLLGVLGSLVGILALLLLLAVTKRRKTNISNDSAEEVSSVDEDDDDKTNIHSLIASSSSAFLGTNSMVPKNSSFVPPDQNNLGAKYSARDVKCCTNFVCDGCAEGQVTFVKSPNKRRSDGFLRRRANSVGDLVCEIVQDRPDAASEV